METEVESKWHEMIFSESRNIMKTARGEMGEKEGWESAGFDGGK